MKGNDFSNFRARYHKYKGRYTDVIKAYTDLQNENAKVKNVMQQTQVPQQLQQIKPSFTYTMSILNGIF